MSSRSGSCCSTGHRPQGFPWKGEPNDLGQIALLNAMAAAIDRAIIAGYRLFIAGNALGVDIWAAMLVLERKLRYPEITLEIAVPFQRHNQNIDGTNGEMPAKIHRSADRITIVAEGVSHMEAFLRRDHCMADNGRMPIAVCDERSGQVGGTASTLRYAKRQGLAIEQIRWMDL